MKNKVLITGANGFLGTQIARRLINNPKLEIIVMVRAENKEHALNRLKRSWHEWDELSKSLESSKNHVKILPGDVRIEKLGLSDEDYQDLASNLTHIIHTVADLRLHAPLDELNLTNVQGTDNLIKLAKEAQFQGKFKLFSHVSTAYVAGKQEGTILEDLPNDLEELNHDKDTPVVREFWSNYEESKYLSEKVVLKSDLPHAIFRPGMVVGDSNTGEIKTFNTVYALIKLYLNGKLRVIPTRSSLKLHMIPVDYVAEAIAELSFNPLSEGKTFHLTPPEEFLPTISQFLESIRKWADSELKIKLPKPIFIPIAPLVQRVSSNSKKNPSGILRILFTLAPYLDEKHTFSRKNTDQLLGHCKIKWDEYLPNLLKFAVYHGFFHISERTVHEQVLMRNKSHSYPVEYYDIIQGKKHQKSTGKLREDVLAALKSLQKFGIEKGDRVALVGLNSTRYLTLELAIGLVGAVSVPLYYTSPPADIKNVLKVSGAKIIFIGTPHLMRRLDELDNSIKMVSFCRETLKIPDKIMSWSEFLENGSEDYDSMTEHLISIENLVSPVNFNDLATIRYTSGTTGEPKGVSFNHGQLRWMAESMASLPPWKDRNREVRYLSFLPMNHVVEGILGTFSPYYAPAPLKLFFLEDFNDLATSLPQVKPTIFFSVPRFYEKLWSKLKESFIGSHYLHTKNKTLNRLLKPIVRRVFLRNSGLNHCSQLIVGSATASQYLIQEYHKLGIEIHNAYGLTEAPLVTLNRRQRNFIGTVGEVLPDTKIKIAADGEVLVKGPQVTQGYFKSNKTPSRKEWLETGDLGFITPEGSLVITGRKKELIINSYGKSIDPLRIEALLRDVPGVEESMLVGEGKPFICGLLWVQDDYNSENIKESIDMINKSLSRPEQVKKWVLLPNDLSVDGGDLTANMKLRREIISRRYEEVIDSLYHGTFNQLILHIGQAEDNNGN